MCVCVSRVMSTLSPVFFNTNFHKNNSGSSSSSCNCEAAMQQERSERIYVESQSSTLVASLQTSLQTTTTQLSMAIATLTTSVETTEAGISSSVSSEITRALDKEGSLAHLLSVSIASTATAAGDIEASLAQSISDSNLLTWMRSVGLSAAVVSEVGGGCVCWRRGRRREGGRGGRGDNVYQRGDTPRSYLPPPSLPFRIPVPCLSKIALPFHAVLLWTLRHRAHCCLSPTWPRR